MLQCLLRSGIGLILAFLCCSRSFSMLFQPQKHYRVSGGLVKKQGPHRAVEFFLPFFLPPFWSGLVEHGGCFLLATLPRCCPSAVTVLQRWRCLCQPPWACLLCLSFDVSMSREQLIGNAARCSAMSPFFYIPNLPPDLSASDSVTE
jgi:hypothetical protein